MELVELFELVEFVVPVWLMQATATNRVEHIKMILFFIIDDFLL